MKTVSAYTCKCIFQQLEMELKKLQTQTSEGTQLFDEALNILFRRKVRTEMATYQVLMKEAKRFMYAFLCRICKSFHVLYTL